MGIPSQVIGAGSNSTARNVFRVKFSEDTADDPKLKAFDDENLNSNVNEVFIGTVGNGSKPMICAIATSDDWPTDPFDWIPSDGIYGSSNQANRLKGNNYYVSLNNGNAVLATYDVKFNLVWDIPFDATVPQTGTAILDAVILVEFTSAGTPPVLTWYFNDESTGGTESSPDWYAFTAGASGDFIIPCDSGVVAPNLVFHKPVSGSTESPEVWVSSS